MAIAVTERGLLLAHSNPFLVFTFFQLFLAWIIHHLLSNALGVFLSNSSLIFLLLSHSCFDLLLHLLHLCRFLLRQVLINFLDSARVYSWTPLSMRWHSPFTTLYLWRTIWPIQINLLIAVIVYSTASSLILQKAFLWWSSTSTRIVRAAKGV